MVNNCLFTPLPTITNYHSLSSSLGPSSPLPMGLRWKNVTALFAPPLIPSHIPFISSIPIIPSAWVNPSFTPAALWLLSCSLLFHPPLVIVTLCMCKHVLTLVFLQIKQKEEPAPPTVNTLCQPPAASFNKGVKSQKGCGWGVAEQTNALVSLSG